MAISIRNRRLSAPSLPAKNKEILHYNSLSLCFVSTPWPVSFIHSPPLPLPSFRYRLQSTAFFSISFFPPLPSPRYFVSRCFVKAPLLYFSRWLASTDYLAGCHLELRIPDNSFPLMVLYEERLFPPHPLPRRSPTIIDGNFWRIEIEILFYCRRIYLNLFPYLYNVNIRIRYIVRVEKLHRSLISR